MLLTVCATDAQLSNLFGPDSSDEGTRIVIISACIHVTAVCD